MISPLDFLTSSRTLEGGWGYAPGHSPAVEPTCAVLLTLHTLNQDTAWEDAVSWLLEIQNPDGGWGYNHLDSTSAWFTAWSVWSLAKTGQSVHQIQKGIDFLRAQDVLQISNLDDLEAGKEVANIDFSLRGWPWRTAESSWVEPTALTMLAFQSAGAADDDRVQEAVAFLENRRCPGGGWNIGNPVMFGEVLPARVEPTAWSLMALAAVAPEKIHEQDIEILLREMTNDAGVMALAWGSLALRSCGMQPVNILLERLLQLQDPDGSWRHNPYLTVLSWLVLAGKSL